MAEAKKLGGAGLRGQVAGVTSLCTVGQSGAGLVSVVMTGRHDVKRITLDDSLMQEDKEVLEDLIAAAVNDAVRKVEQNSQEKMSGMTAGMQLPPGFKMPF